jgi:hypothetical protein
MAKPLTPTPVIKGKAAEKIRQELTHGTPTTPKRLQQIRLADEVYRRVSMRRSQTER